MASARAQRRLEALIATKPPLSSKELALDGKKLMAALQVGPSPILGEATRYLMELVLDDPSLNTESTLTERVQAWARARG